MPSMHPFNPDGVLAYFISFRCYGTWLHGDDRGSMNRSTMHGYGTPPIKPDTHRKHFEETLLQYPPFNLDQSMRALVEQTIREVCTARNWHLHAVNAQSEHIHTVISASQTRPEKVLNDFKSWSTRRLRENSSDLSNRPIWSRHGSTVWLWTENQLANAIQYTISGQGEPPSSCTG